jgi:hydroxyacylglutathione hydrolase
LHINQIRVGLDNFSYLIHSKSNRAVVVDPGFEPKKIIDFIQSNDLILEYIILTHHHTDHSFGVKELKKNCPKSKVVASIKNAGNNDTQINLYVDDGDEINIDEIKMSFISTPGHTKDSICIIINNEAILTGDTLFIGDCGRTDLSGGNMHEMYDTLKNKIIKLPDHLIVYPGHDYGDKPYDKLGNQKRTNKILKARDFEDFSKI